MPSIKRNDTHLSIQPEPKIPFPVKKTISHDVSCEIERKKLKLNCFHVQLLGEHLFSIHKQANLAAADVEATRVKAPPPITCPVCPETIQCWDSFYKHFEDHCAIRSGSAGSHTNGSQSRRGGNSMQSASHDPLNLGHPQNVENVTDGLSADEWLSLPFDPSLTFTRDMSQSGNTRI
jgi:hypothetical protein